MRTGRLYLCAGTTDDQFGIFARSPFAGRNFPGAQAEPILRRDRFH